MRQAARVLTCDEQEAVQAPMNEFKNRVNLEIHVSVLEVRPRGPACAVTTEISYPTTAVLIPRTDKAVRFEMASADLDCTSFRSGVGS